MFLSSQTCLVYDLATWFTHDSLFSVSVLLTMSKARSPRRRRHRHNNYNTSQEDSSLTYSILGIKWWKSRSWCNSQRNIHIPTFIWTLEIYNYCVQSQIKRNLGIDCRRRSREQRSTILLFCDWNVVMCWYFGANPTEKRLKILQTESREKWSCNESDCWF